MRNILYTFSLFLVLPSLCGGSTSENALFNGEDLSGWEKRGGDATFSVVDGEIVGRSAPNTPNTFLCTEDRFDDFELNYEYKCDPNLNSGVQIRANAYETKTTVKYEGATFEFPAGRVHGYQVEIDPNKPDRLWSGGIYDEGRRGWLFPGKNGGDPSKFTEIGKESYKPGDWNAVRVVCQGNQIKTWLNDVPRSDFQDNMTSSGFIALQVHGVGDRKDPLEVRFRNISIRTLGKASDAGDIGESGSDEWISLFNGKNLDGWAVSENEASIFVEDNLLVTNGERAHAFYVGDPEDKSDEVFKDFHLKAKVKTMPVANSGIYFHTKYLDSGWPNQGYEAQVNNTQGDPKKTGGLYGVQDNFVAPVSDNEWFDYEIIVRDRRIMVKINDKVISDYTEPRGLVRPKRQLSSGTFALQAHDPGSKVYYKDLMVRRLQSNLGDPEITAADEKSYLVFEPKSNPNGKHVVLIAGDEEYRSEESCPMLGKILSQKHGFRCTVAFSVDPEKGFINPNEQRNIPGVAALESADLMIIGTRFRDLYDDQMAHILNYLNEAKPIIGFRTATHAFKPSCKYGGYDWASFGANVIGENWVAHHGKHKVEGGRSVAVAGHEDHPILRSVGQFFTPSDIYTVKRVTPENAQILLRGEVTETLAPSSRAVSGKKNNPLQPFVWLRSYDSPSGKQGQVLGTTAGASVDFTDANLRRLIVNAAYYLTGLDVPEHADVDPIDEFNPSFYGFYTDEGFFEKRNLRVEDYKLGSSKASIP